MHTVCKFSDFKVVVQETFDSTKPNLNIILKNGETFLYLKDLDDARDVANVLSVYDDKIKSTMGKFPLDQKLKKLRLKKFKSSGQGLIAA